MPKIDVESAPDGSGSRYPEPYNKPCLGRRWKKLGDAAGLSQFGVNLVTLDPGVWSSQRHWHTHEDEFVYILEGEIVLVTDAGEEVLRPGDSVGFPANRADGHCLQNRSSAPVKFLAIGTRVDADACHYPDIDMYAPAERYSGGTGPLFVRKDGSHF